jgi:uncharacterized membrane protein
MPIYNIHPLVVHFPIALLSTYAFLEIIRFRHFETKAVLLLLGTVASYAAIGAGLMAKTFFHDEATLHLINTHELLGIITSTIFTIISIVYIRAWHKQLAVPFRKILALVILGIMSVFITGALGGSIVYGQTNDPVTHFIYNLFF